MAPGRAKGSERASAITEGIRVSVESRYQPEQSNPREQRYVFSYTVSLENLGRGEVVLKSRYWRVSAAGELVQEVRGAGVVGAQPTLASGERFQYTSGAMLAFPSGFMEGSYAFLDVARKETFDVAIPRFKLTLPISLN